jgi:hypothetical protein
MKYRIISALCFVICVVATGCQRPDDAAPVTGGRGGMATLIVSPEHHGLYVDSCTVYIKYATNDAPANGVYDDSTICVMNDTIPQATFALLKKGRYYLYGVGYHKGFIPPFVKGGIPAIIETENVEPKIVYLPTYEYNP